MLDYVYDKLGRIKEAGKERFAFDPANNILSNGMKDKGRLNNSAHLYAGNRLKEYNGTEYTYDALGNLIYRQLPNGENQYFIYDTENQLTRAEIKKPAGNTEVWEYAYDPFGRRLSKERKDKLAWVSTEPKRTHFVWDGSRLLQEYTYKGNYTYIYTDQDSYEPLAQVFYNGKDDKQYLAYFHNDQIGIPREMTDQFGNLLWYGEYTAWGRLKKDERVYKDVHQPFRLQNQYCDQETGLHYNFFRYYEPDTGRFVNQDPIGLLGGDNLYFFASNATGWVDFWGLSKNRRATVGGTPQKTSPTGRAVMQRMLDAGQIRGMTSSQIDALRRPSDIPRSAQFWDVSTQSWQSVRSAHMGHIEDAVDYWNRRGRFFGRRSAEVRAWMRDPSNYQLEKGIGKGGNCSRGAKNKARYDMNTPIGPRQRSDYGFDD